MRIRVDKQVSKVSPSEAGKRSAPVQKKQPVQAPKAPDPRPEIKDSAAVDLENKIVVAPELPKPEPVKPEEAFMKSLTENLSKEEISELGTQAVVTMQQNELKPGTRLEHVLAAHTYNHVKGSLKEALPGVKANKLVSQAMKQPELKGKAELLQATSQFLRAEKAPQAKPSAQQPLPKAVSNPSFYELDPAEQARKQAEAASRQREWADTLAKMREEDRLTAAKIHKIMSDAMQSVSDILLSIFSRRLKNARDHHNQWTYLMTEVWPRR